MIKTIVVAIERRKSHPLYKKSYLVTTRFQAHDEKGEAKMGDMVEIIETRPISKYKHFMLAKVLERAVSKTEISE
jgi:small subunit ribosomal protein S17